MLIKNLILVFGCLIALVGQNSYAQKVVPENDNSTGAFVQLCGNLNDVDAQNFCFGFGEGVYQTYVADHPKSTTEFCIPKGGDTRQDILKAFLIWNQKTPQFNNDPASKSIIRFFKTQYPCK